MISQVLLVDAKAWSVIGKTIQHLWLLNLQISHSEYTLFSAIFFVRLRALTDRQKLGLTVRTYCGVVREADVSWEALANDLAKIDGVVSVFAVSGDVDLMLEIVARDMDQ